MGHCRWVVPGLILCTVLAGVAGQGQYVKPSGTGLDPLAKPDDQFDMYGDDYSLSAEAYSGGALGIDNTAGIQPTTAAYRADYDDDYAMPNPTAQLEEECADTRNGAPLNKTDVCEVRIRGADAKVALLHGGVDGLYKPVACNDGRPMYVRQGSPPQEDRVLWWSNRFADWDLSNGTKPVNDDVLMYGGGPGDLQPQHVTQWHIATEFRVDNTSPDDYMVINITVGCASLMQAEMGQGSTIISGGGRDSQQQVFNATRSSRDNTTSSLDASSSSSGNRSSSNSSSSEISGSGRVAGGGVEGQQQGEEQLQEQGTGSGTDSQQQAGAGTAADAGTTAEQVTPLVGDAGNVTAASPRVQAEAGSGSNDGDAQRQETGTSADAQAAASTSRGEGEGQEEKLGESASAGGQGDPSTVQQRGSEAGASTDDRGGINSGATASGQGQQEPAPLQLDDEGFTDEDVADTSSRELQGPLLSDEEMEQQYSLVYKRAQQAAVSKSSANSVLVGIFMMAAVGIAVGMPLIYAKHQRNRGGAAEGSERSVYIALSQAVRGRRRARE